LEILVKNNKDMEHVLSRIYDREEKLIYQNSFFTKILRKANEEDEQKLKRDLLSDLRIIYNIKEGPLEYVKKNLTDPVRQFILYKLDRVYFKGFASNFSVIESVNEPIPGTINYFGQTNFQNITEYVCKDVPSSENNITMSKNILSKAISALEKELQE
jgi:hypothetical protein